MEEVFPPPLLAYPQVLEGAGFGIRFLARCVDTFLALFVGYGGGILGGFALIIMSRANLLPPDWRDRIHTDGIHLGVFVFSLLGNVFYHSVTEGFYGASLGKMVCKLRVIDQNENPCRFKGALIRSLAYYVDGLFFGCVGYASMKNSPLQQRYGDVWGKTMVVKSKDVPEASKRPIWFFFIYFVLGVLGEASLLAFAFVLQVKY